MAIKGDPMVYTTQHWLNVTFGKYVESGRFKTITEDGITGMGTINGLIRGLQIILGIQETADNFGAGTQKLFRDITRDDNVCDDIYGIVQGALWCKGYDCGHYAVNTDDGEMLNCIFDEKVENAVKKLESDAGRTNPKGIVDLNVMKALLSMDYFVCNTYYGGNQKIREIQQYLNRNYEEYIGLRPCDGIYSRRTNLAIIYAIQAEEQIPVGTANGNFGESTKKCLPLLPYSGGQKSYTGKTYSDVQIKKFIILLNIGLYVNGFGDGNISDVYDKEIVKQFQKEYALSVDGLSGKGTWMSLFLSSGDTTRSAKACDCATILDEDKANTLYNAGYRYVGRYLSGTAAGGVSKALSKEELNLAFDKGLRIFPIFQGSANNVKYFTEEQAQHDVANALKYGTLLGLTKGTIIYYAVDCDPLDDEITKYIIPYFKEIKKDSNIYIVGIYGTRNVCSRVCVNGYAESSFVCDMSTGFSGNLGFPLPNNWAFDQFATTTVGSGNGKIEIDKDAYSGRDSGVSLIENQTERMYENLEKIFDLALEYTGNDDSKSNMLVLQYFRKLGGYGGDLFSSDSSSSALRWEIVAGEIDNNFCNQVDSKLNDMNFSYYDPVNTDVKYDINHFCATLNTILYNPGTGNNQNWDQLTNIYAGWGGDALSFAKDVAKAAENGESDINSWAKQNICTDASRHFPLQDYYADLDAINISNLMSENKINFPEAFKIYFDTHKEEYASRRTVKYMNSVGGISYIEWACDLINADELQIFKFILSDGKDDQKYFDAALSAYKSFIVSEYGHGR